MKWIIYVCVLSFLFACELDKPKTEAERIVEASIHAHGGLAYWKSLETIQFRKKTWLYHEDNSLEKYSDELHTLHQKDTLFGQIASYDQSAQNYKVQFANGKGEKISNGKSSDGTNAFLASHFVVNQPFKILDPGVELSYLGVDTLDGRQAVDVVKAFYGDKDDDVWWFYFDQVNHVLLATLIYHAPTYAFVVNEEIQEVDGLLWNTRRTTYRTDSLRNIQYIRAKFEYSEIRCK